MIFMDWGKLVPELDVTDFERSVWFYTDVLGFEILFSREQFVYLELEGVQFMLQSVGSDGWQLADLERPFGRGVNFQIELDDIGPVYARLRAASYPLFRDRKETWYETGGGSLGPARVPDPRPGRLSAQVLPGAGRESKALR